MSDGEDDMVTDYDIITMAFKIVKSAEVNGSAWQDFLAMGPHGRDMIRVAKVLSPSIVEMYGPTMRQYMSEDHPSPDNDLQPVSAKSDQSSPTEKGKGKAVGANQPSTSAANYEGPQYRIIEGRAPSPPRIVDSAEAKLALLELMKQSKGESASPIKPKKATTSYGGKKAPAAEMIVETPTAAELSNTWDEDAMDIDTSPPAGPKDDSHQEVVPENESPMEPEGDMSVSDTSSHSSDDDAGDEAYCHYHSEMSDKTNWAEPYSLVMLASKDEKSWQELMDTPESHNFVHDLVTKGVAEDPKLFTAATPVVRRFMGDDWVKEAGQAYTLNTLQTAMKKSLRDVSTPSPIIDHPSTPIGPSKTRNPSETKISTASTYRKAQDNDSDQHIHTRSAGIKHPRPNAADDEYAHLFKNVVGLMPDLFNKSNKVLGSYYIIPSSDTTLQQQNAMQHDRVTHRPITQHQVDRGTVKPNVPINNTALPTEARKSGPSTRTRSKDSQPENGCAIAKAYPGYGYTRPTNRTRSGSIGVPIAVQQSTLHVPSAKEEDDNMSEVGDMHTGWRSVLPCCKSKLFLIYCSDFKNETLAVEALQRENEENGLASSFGLWQRNYNAGVWEVVNNKPRRKKINLYSKLSVTRFNHARGRPKVEAIDDDEIEIIESEEEKLKVRAMNPKPRNADDSVEPQTRRFHSFMGRLSEHLDSMSTDMDEEETACRTKMPKLRNRLSTIKLMVVDEMKKRRT
ncbi:hypothetical protein CALVIDRAFT_525560 [Calocera viscosa TUFC12733]|uniref:Uncharacterized protein n=1 Tax=Calocera viscosa (strain TUFC12733) TaxID=1330018 RepID=A0A167PPW2_CALVF|nr:hypothetical protein CALVIDRAFT_525560 [Calocera viscosa TUFC12733]